MKNTFKCIAITALIIVCCYLGYRYYTTKELSFDFKKVTKKITDIGEDLTAFGETVATNLGETNYDLDDESIFDSEHEIFSSDTEMSFAAKDVTIINLSASGCKISYELTDDSEITVKAKNPGSFQAYLDNQLLTINSTGPTEAKKDESYSVITISVPKTKELGELKLSLGAGTFSADEIKSYSAQLAVGAGSIDVNKLSTSACNVKVDAGNATIKEAHPKALIATVGMGNFKYEGAVDSASITCSLGNASLELKGNFDDYNYVYNAAGRIDLNGQLQTGISTQQTIDNSSDNTIELICSLGNISLKFVD